ncbi:hypothetical protein WN51_06129 [Melipona quadrifasciata]|uniref:Uncharacterized protein n=1 Tax=Melipona quadrifasciata TaxID=166423 RepID=A0A0M8ZP52_9HYME|nr:hypothetical protein WN51_06129 [Melipona quadrifasciata]
MSVFIAMLTTGNRFDLPFLRFDEPSRRPSLPTILPGGLCKPRSKTHCQGLEFFKLRACGIWNFALSLESVIFRIFRTENFRIQDPQRNLRFCRIWNAQNFGLSLEIREQRELTQTSAYPRAAHTAYLNVHTKRSQSRNSPYVVYQSEDYGTGSVSQPVTYEFNVRNIISMKIFLGTFEDLSCLERNFHALNDSDFSAQ